MTREKKEPRDLGPDAKALGAVVRTLRKKQGMSIAELAEGAGTDEATIERVEQGDSVSFDLLPSLAAGLGVDVYDVVNLTEEAQEVDPAQAQGAGDAARMAMGRVVKGFRDERHLTQADLAKRAGLPLIELVLIEAGRIEPTWGKLRRLAYGLDMDLPQLIQEVEMKESS